MIEAPLADLGCEIADMVLARFRSRATLRVFIYSQPGVTVDVCARASALIGDIIDGTELFPGGYTLEVSSPGLDRPLTTAADFRYRVGETVAIRPVAADTENLTAQIIAANDTEVQFKNEVGLFVMKLDEIEQARIIY